MCGGKGMASCSIKQIKHSIMLYCYDRYDQFKRFAFCIRYMVAVESLLSELGLSVGIWDKFYPFSTELRQQRKFAKSIHKNVPKFPHTTTTHTSFFGEDRESLREWTIKNFLLMLSLSFQCVIWVYVMFLAPPFKVFPNVFVAKRLIVILRSQSFF